MDNNYILIFEEFATKYHLNPNSSIVLSFIINRYKLSIGNPQFYSESMHDYFCIYTHQQLAKDTNLSVSGIRNIIAKLVKGGFLKLLLKDNHINLIFLTEKTKEVAGIDPTIIQQPNLKKKINYISKSYTKKENTKKHLTQKSMAKNNMGDVKKYQQVKLNKKTNNNYINKLYKIGMSKKVISILQEFTNNSVSKMYLIVGIIMKAKNHAKFEDITTTKKLEDNLYQILHESVENANFEGTLFNKIHKLFIFHSIPKRQIQYHRVETVPFYLKADYQPQAMDPVEVAELKAKSQKLLDKLNKKTHVLQN